MDQGRMEQGSKDDLDAEAERMSWEKFSFFFYQLELPGLPGWAD
jgi:hypothetical protein